MTDPLERMVSETVVLDTATQIIYIGQLVEVTETNLVLENADMHDCREGHAGKDAYLAETRQTGVTVNRRRIVVMRSAVISTSLLQDVVMD